MDLERVEENPLWNILVEAVHALPMYPSHKAYTRDVLLHEDPNISPEAFSQVLNIPLGEGLVILHELRKESKEEPGRGKGETPQEEF